MPRLSFNFAQMAQPGGGQDDRVDPHALQAFQAALARNCQVSRRVLEKIPGWMRLTGLSPTGYAMQCDGTSGMGATFPDHADYDLGLRWTIDVVFKATNISAQHPIYWRADDSNAQIVSLECKTDGSFLFTHLDADDTETTLTSPHTIGAGGTARIRVARFKNELRMWVDGRQSASRTDLSATALTKPADNKWFVGMKTVSDGDTGSTSMVGVVDELRVFRDEIRDQRWMYAEYPDLADPNLVLYARFNETSGAVTDYSKNGNDGSVANAPTRDATALVTAIAPILKAWFLRTTGGIEQWLAFSNGGLYAVDVR
jgi:hypothetical protein